MADNDIHMTSFKQALADLHPKKAANGNIDALAKNILYAVLTQKGRKLINAGAKTADRIKEALVEGNELINSLQDEEKKEIIKLFKQHFKYSGYTDKEICTTISKKFRGGNASASIQIYKIMYMIFHDRISKKS